MAHKTDNIVTRSKSVTSSSTSVVTRSKSVTSSSTSPSSTITLKLNKTLAKQKRNYKEINDVSSNKRKPETKTKTKTKTKKKGTQPIKKVTRDVNDEESNESGANTLAKISDNMKNALQDVMIGQSNIVDCFSPMTMDEAKTDSVQFDESTKTKEASRRLFDATTEAIHKTKTAGNYKTTGESDDESFDKILSTNSEENQDETEEALLTKKELLVVSLPAYLMHSMFILIMFLIQFYVR
jgi:hypothetical protein